MQHPSSSSSSAVSSTYRTKISGHVSIITVTWSRNLLAHSLSVSVGEDHHINLDLPNWHFWRKTGTKTSKTSSSLKLLYDLRAAKFHGEPEPVSHYYVALVHDEEIVLLLGDSILKKPGLRPANIEAAFVSKKQHVFGKKRFATKSRFGDKGRVHDILIDCGVNEKAEAEMVVSIDGDVAVRVKRLQWKFRGNEVVVVRKERVEVYWDVHDWLFSPGSRHAVFVFKVLMSQRSSVLASDLVAPPVREEDGGGSSLLLYAWKLE